MRTSALVRLSTVVTGAALGLSLAPPATADATPLPVAVPDTVSVYPGQVVELNVLANDTSPTGESLELCRFPDFNPLSDLVPAEDIPVMAMALPAVLDGKPGDVVVGAVRGTTHQIDYYICDQHHLVPARLTVQLLPVSPVKVRKVAGKPGRLTVENTNDVPITFQFGHPRGGRLDGRVQVPAGATRTVTVRRTAVAWNAAIGDATGEWESRGSADHGRVKGIKLNGRPLPGPRAPFEVGAPQTG